MRDPAGHSYGTDDSAGAFAGWAPQDWQALQPWLRGVDLFNHFYFWEAHEAWETLWREAPRNSDAKLFLQGLIQVSAALLKVHIGSVQGAASLSSTGIQKLTSVSAGTPTFMGLDVSETATNMRTYFSPLAHGVLPELDDGVPTLRLVADRPPGDART